MKLPFAIGLIMLAIAGCASKGQPTPPTYSGCRTFEKQAGAPNLQNVFVLSPELAKVIGVQDVIPSLTGAGLAAVQAVVYNCTDLDVVLQVRTRFQGSRGQSEPPSAWKTVHLAPRAQAVYEESAVSPNSRGVAVDIYDANRGQSQFAPAVPQEAPKTP